MVFLACLKGFLHVLDFLNVSKISRIFFYITKVHREVHIAIQISQILYICLYFFGKHLELVSMCMNFPLNEGFPRVRFVMQT
jgi:hypothetical protein